MYYFYEDYAINLVLNMIFMNSFFFIVSIFLFIETIAIIKLFENIKKRKVAKPIKPISIIDIADGVCAIQGKIVALEEPLLISPYRKIECVYYDFRIRKQTKIGRGVSWWDNIVLENKSLTVGIDDGNEILEVDLRKANLLIGDKFKTISPRFKFPNDYQRKLLLKYSSKEKPFSYGYRTSYSETLIREGTEVYLQANFKHYVADSRMLFNDAQNIIISQGGKGGLIAEYQTNILMSVLGVVIGIAILFFYFL